MGWHESIWCFFFLMGFTDILDLCEWINIVLTNIPKDGISRNTSVYTYRQTYRQTDRPTDRPADRLTDRQTDRQTCMPACMHTYMRKHYAAFWGKFQILCASSPPVLPFQLCTSIEARHCWRENHMYPTLIRWLDIASYVLFCNTVYLLQ